MKNVINIKGRKDIIKDSNSGAILSTNVKALNEYKQKIEEQEKIDKLEHRTNLIENEISEVKQMIRVLLNRGN